MFIRSIIGRENYNFLTDFLIKNPITKVIEFSCLFKDFILYCISNYGLLKIKIGYHNSDY